MLEFLCLVFFGLIIYTFLVVVPTVVEKLASEDFRASYFSHLANKWVNSYGK